MNESKEEVLSPIKATRDFRSDLSSAALFLNVALFIYFASAMSVSLSLNWYFGSWEARTPEDFGWFAFSVLMGIAVGLSLSSCFVSSRFKKNKVTSARVFRWKGDGIREWQVKKFKEKLNISHLSDDKKEKVLDAHIDYAKNQLDSISPIIKPAIIMSLILPIYTIALRKYFSFVNDLNQLLLAVLVLLLLFVLVFAVIYMGASIYALFNKEREQYKELLEVLDEIKFQVLSQVKDDSEAFQNKTVNLKRPIRLRLRAQSRAL